jgi:hypothetical protein
MKLNFGCGHNRLDGFVNVDAAAACDPDEVWDLEQTPWPWPDNSVSEAAFIHSLEHMGANPKVFLTMMQELYRVLAPDGSVVIHVPHPRHDNFINDPTHVRAITPEMLSLFDRDLNDQWKAQGGANSPLAHYTGVHFKVAKSGTVLAEPYASALKEGKLTGAQVAQAERSQNNVAAEYRITLRAIKN